MTARALSATMHIKDPMERAYTRKHLSNWVRKNLQYDKWGYLMAPPVDSNVVPNYDLLRNSWGRTYEEKEANFAAYQARQMGHVLASARLGHSLLAKGSGAYRFKKQRATRGQLFKKRSNRNC